MLAKTTLVALIHSWVGCCAKEKRKIHVNGIPKEWKNADLENYFKQFVLAFFKGELRNM